MNTTSKLANGRGCGYREPGSSYLCTGKAIGGLPIEDFIMDPAIPLEEMELRWSRGYQIINNPITGINHVVICVSDDYYKAAWDFVEEGRVAGISRKVNDNFPFEKMTPGKSRMIFAHKKLSLTSNMN